MKNLWDKTVDPMAKVGMRVRLIQMVDDPNPIDDKLEGTIDSIDDLGTLHVNWDDGRRLGIVPEIDKYELLPPSDEQIDLEDMIESFATDKSKINKSMPKPTVRNSKLAIKFRSELKKTKPKVKDIKVEGDLEETSTAGGVSTGHFEGPLGGKDETIIKKPFAKQIGKELTGKKSISNPIGKIYTILPKTESKIFKFKDLVINEKFVSKAQQRYLYANEPDVADEFNSTMTSKDYEELPEKVKKTKEDVDETTTHASVWGANGPPVVPIFGAKGKDHIPSRKPIWKGGKIVQKIKNDGVLTEIKNGSIKFTKKDMEKLHKDGKLEKDGNSFVYSESKLFQEVNKIKWVKGGKFVKIKDKCAKYNNQPWCSQGAIDNPLELSDTTFENVEKISKKIGMKEDLIIDTIMSKVYDITLEKKKYNKRPTTLMW